MLVEGAPVCELGEGPVWDLDRDELVWVDLLAGLIHRGVHRDPKHTQVTTARVGEPVGCLVPRDQGGWVLAGEKGFVLADEALTQFEAINPPVLTSTDGLRFNDGGCDSAGRFFAGTLAYDGVSGQGALFRLDPDQSVHTVWTGLGIANGIGWSPDDQTIYHVDSTAATVYAADYDLATGSVGERRRLLELPPGGAVPDGLAVDIEGGLWVALWGGGEVLHLDPSGRITDRIALPVPQPTSVAFAGPDSTQLFITSAREGLSDSSRAAHPESGRVFVAAVDVPGREIHGWAG